MAAEEQHIIQIVESQFTQMKNMSLHYHNNPYFPENVHQYRVHMRRLRSLLNFIKPIIDEESYLEINDLLREQGQQLSPIRDIDVFIENMNETAKNKPDLIDNYADLFEFLHEERLRIIHEYASDEDIEASKKRITQIGDRLTQLSFDSEDRAYEGFVEKRFDKNKEKLKKSIKKYLIQIMNRYMKHVN